MNNETTLRIPVIFEVVGIYQYDKIKDILNDAATHAIESGIGLLDYPFQIDNTDVEIKAVDNIKSFEWFHNADKEIEEFKTDENAAWFRVKAWIPVILKHSFDLSEMGLESKLKQAVIDKMVWNGAGSLYYKEIDEEIIYYVEKEKKYTITRTHTAKWEKVITEEELELNGKTLDQYISDQHAEGWYSFIDSADLDTNNEISVEEE